MRASLEPPGDWGRRRCGKGLEGGGGGREDGAGGRKGGALHRGKGREVAEGEDREATPGRAGQEARLGGSGRRVGQLMPWCSLPQRIWIERRGPLGGLGRPAPNTRRSSEGCGVAPTGIS